MIKVVTNINNIDRVVIAETLAGVEELHSQNEILQDNVCDMQ